YASSPTAYSSRPAASTAAAPSGPHGRGRGVSSLRASKPTTKCAVSVRMGPPTSAPPHRELLPGAEPSIDWELRSGPPDQEPKLRPASSEAPRRVCTESAPPAKPD